MPTYTVHQAKTNLSNLIAEAEAGVEVIIARDDKPAVRLMAIEKKQINREFGAYKGQFTVPDSFFDPLPADETRQWEAAPIFPDAEVGPSKPARKRRTA